MADFDDILLKPNIEPLDTNTQRIRRNLIFTSIIALFLTLGSDGIDTKEAVLAGSNLMKLKKSIYEFLLFWHWFTFLFILFGPMLIT